MKRKPLHWIFQLRDVNAQLMRIVDIGRESGGQPYRWRVTTLRFLLYENTHEEERKHSGGVSSTEVSRPGPPAWLTKLCVYLLALRIIATRIALPSVIAGTPNNLIEARDLSRQWRRILTGRMLWIPAGPKKYSLPYATIAVCHIPSNWRPANRENHRQINNLYLILRFNFVEAEETTEAWIATKFYSISASLWIGAVQGGNLETRLAILLPKDQRKHGNDRHTTCPLLTPVSSKAGSGLREPGWSSELAGVPSTQLCTAEIAKYIRGDVRAYTAT